MSLEISGDGITKIGAGSVGLRPMPVFFAYKTGAQSLSSTVSAVIQLNSKLYDTEEWFSTSTYRFTPQIAGYYQINACVFVTGTGITRHIPSFQQNSTTYRVGYGPAYDTATTDSSAISGGTIFYFNGSTDFIQLTTLVTGSSALQVEGSISGDTYMSGFLVRPD
jgi:hypothetical protein